MISSNINEIILKNEIKESSKVISSNDFLNSLFSISKEEKNTNIDRDDSLGDLLHSSISDKLDNEDKKVTDVISQDRLNEILTSVNSFNFISALSRTTKDQYGRYKDDDEENNYSFLYNDYALKYQELVYKYKEIDIYSRKITK